MKTLPDILREHKDSIRGVIHIGAHIGQEYETYVFADIPNIMMIEPQADAFAELQKRCGTRCTLINTALGNTQGTVDMHVDAENRGESACILEPLKHLEHYPHIHFPTVATVPITKLDLLEFDRSQFNFINIDVEGYELEVFKGGLETLKTIDFIYAEVARAELQKNRPLLGDVTLFLEHLGFNLAEVSWGGGSFGQGFYSRSF